MNKWKLRLRLSKNSFYNIDAFFNMDESQKRYVK